MVCLGLFGSDLCPGRLQEQSLAGTGLTPHASSVRLISLVDLYLPPAVLLIPKLIAKSHSCLSGRMALLPKNRLLSLPRAVNVSLDRGCLNRVPAR